VVKDQELKNQRNLKNQKQQKKHETTIGYEVTAYTKKNKTAPPDRRAAFRIIFSQGLFDEECWFDQCIKYGLIKERTQARYEIVAFENELGSFYKTQWMEILQSDKKIYDNIKRILIDKMTIKLQLDDYKIEDEDVAGDNTNDYKVETEDEA
jgi:hypothetical protein